MAASAASARACSTFSKSSVEAAVAAEVAERGGVEVGGDGRTEVVAIVRRGV